MRIERLDAASDPDAVGACYQMYLAGAPVDDPRGPALSDRSFGGWLAYGWTEDHPETWLARDAAGTPCGWYSLTAPQRENTHLGHLALLVSPSHRRHGVGTELARHAAARARELGRASLLTESLVGTAGEAFARSLGAQAGITEVRRVLTLGTIPEGHLARLRAEAEAAARGYVLASWEGPVPEEHLMAVAELNLAMADAPHNPGYEPEVWDARRVRDSQRRLAAQGLRYYSVAASFQATGELAGLTQLGVDPLTPEWGFQELTAVTRAHRGHRLGLLVKVAMLDLLAEREPQLRSVITGNADANKHMIAINTELGFVVLDQALSWAIEVARVLAPA